MLLGIAIGDALGATSEGLKPPERHKLYGEIRDYQPDRRPGHNRPTAVGTDDTQMSFWTVEQLMDDHGLVPDSLAHKFCEHRIWGIGETVRKFIANFKDGRLPWYLAGSKSLGNGALMRIAPVILPYLRSPHPSMYADAAIATMITHNDFANNATSVAFIHMLWELLGMDSVPGPEWWIDTYCNITRELEGNTRYHAAGAFGEYSGPLWKFVANACEDALKRRLAVEEACERWGSGANLFETVPSVLYILATNAGNPEEALIRAVNDTEDNDSIASIVGAAVGALHGLSGIPERWVKNLKGRITEKGDNQVIALISQSKQVFWSHDRPKYSESEARFMDRKLSEEQLNELLPCLKQLAEFISAGETPDMRMFHEITSNIKIQLQGWVVEELELWSHILIKSRDNSYAEDAIVAELQERGIPEFSAILAYRSARQPMKVEPKSADFGRLKIGEHAEPRTLIVTGGHITKAICGHRLKVTLLDAGLAKTLVRIELVGGVAGEIISEEVILRGNTGEISVPVTAQWEAEPPVLSWCPLCGDKIRKKSLFFNKTARKYECLNVDCKHEFPYPDKRVNGYNSTHK